MKTDFFFFKGHDSDMNTACVKAVIKLLSLYVSSRYIAVSSCNPQYLIIWTIILLFTQLLVKSSVSTPTARVHLPNF